MAKSSSKKTKKLTKPTGMSIDELRADLVTMQTDLVEAKRSLASKELVNTARLKELRQQIARIKSALTQQLKEKEL